MEKTLSNKIYQQKNNFWISYSPNSGTCKPLNSSYITDKQGDNNQDNSLTNQLVRFSDNTTPLKKKGNLSIYVIPIYQENDATQYDIWGGDVKPATKRYCVVSKGNINVITFFDTKKEAFIWVKTTL